MPDAPAIRPAGTKEDGWCEADPHAGTINVLLLIDWPLTPAALARDAITLTEAKSAALQELAVSSRSSAGLATGTAPTSTPSPRPSTTAGPRPTPAHARLSERRPCLQGHLVHHGTPSNNPRGLLRLQGKPNLVYLGCVDVR